MSTDSKGPERPTTPPLVRRNATAAEKAAVPPALDVHVSSNPPGRISPIISSLPPAGFGENSPLSLPSICSYGRFELLGRLAFGGMAEIFLAREATTVGTARLIAIKRILPRVAGEPEFVRMFHDEARLAVQLQHPSICHLYEFGELEGTYFIAMEWIHGTQLGKVIRAARAHGGVPPEIAARIVAHVAEALHYAHRLRDQSGEPLGIVHRDVSPHNVMVGYDGHVKLLDFGIAKASSQQAKTEAGVVKGKFAYMAPEQCLGKPVDARADVFALGICLYEVLTGETLYQRPTDYETMHAVLKEPVPSVRASRPDVPAELEAIVRTALQKEPDARWKSAGAMHAALDDWLAKRGQAVGARAIAGLMGKLFEDQIRAGPLVDSTPFGASVVQRPPAASPPGSSADAATRVGSSALAKSPVEWGSLDLEGASDPPPAPALERRDPSTGRFALRPAPIETPLDVPGSLPAAGVPSLDLAFNPHRPVRKPRPPGSEVHTALGPPATPASGMPIVLRWILSAVALVVALGVASIAYRAIVRHLNPNGDVSADR